jgi:hypothetical protein
MSINFILFTLLIFTLWTSNIVSANELISEYSGEICRAALNEELGKNFSIVSISDEVVKLDEYKGRTFSCNYDSLQLTIYNTTTPEVTKVATYKIFTKSTELKIKKISGDKNNYNEITIPTKKQNVASQKNDSKYIFTLLISIAFVSFLVIYILKNTTQIFSNPKSASSNTKKSIAIVFVISSCIIYLAAQREEPDIKSQQNTPLKTNEIDAKEAQSLCFKAYDFRYNINHKTIAIAPWKEHPTKAFRVAFKFEGHRGGFGCTVYKNGKLEINYNE